MSELKPTRATALVSPDGELLHAKLAEQEKRIAGLEEQLKYAKAPVDKGIPMHTYRVVCEQRDHELGERQRMTHLYEIEVLRNRDLERALATPPTAAAEAVEGMRRALECQKCYCVYAVNPQNMSAAAIESGAESELIQQCARCAALAAWKEATRG